jgi:putative flippase GtrA
MTREPNKTLSVEQIQFVARAIRFVAVGLTATLVHIAIAALCIEAFAVKPAPANVCAFLGATGISYVGHTYWSFQKTSSSTNLLRFVVVLAVGVLLSATVSGTVAYMHFNHWVGIVAVVLVVPPVTFILHSSWTYRI